MTTNSRVAAGLLLLVGSVASAQEEGPPEPVRLPGQVDEFSGERIGFQHAIERALRQNPQMVLASEDVARARAIYEQVRAQSLPTIAANGAYTRLDDDRRLNGNVILGENQISANLQIAAPLLQPRAWAQWAHARDNVKVSSLGAEEARRQLAVLTGRAYLTVLTQKRLLEVARTARDAARAQLGFSKARYAGGLGTRIDETRAAQELATDESRVATARLQLRRAREVLGVLVAADGPLDATDDPTLDDHETMDSALGGVDKRPDLRAASERRDAAHRVTRDSFVDYLPLLSGVFQPFFQDPPSLTIPRTGWQAQLVLTVPLFDGGLRYGLRRERSAIERQARAQLEGALRQARSEVRVAFDSVREADRALVAARDAARLAQETLELLTKAYRAGAATNLELIDAERQARDAATVAALGEDTARQARLELLAASGHFPDASPRPR